MGISTDSVNTGPLITRPACPVVFRDNLEQHPIIQEHITASRSVSREQFAIALSRLEPLFVRKRPTPSGQKDASLIRDKNVAVAICNVCGRRLVTQHSFATGVRANAVARSVTGQGWRLLCVSLRSAELPLHRPSIRLPTACYLEDSGKSAVHRF